LKFWPFGAARPATAAEAMDVVHTTVGGPNSVKLLSTRQVLVRIAAIVVSVELLIMLALVVAPHTDHPYWEAVLDVASLALFSTPLMYLWVIRPFVTARDEALAQINRLAHIDPLTKLANRRLLSKHLERDIAGSDRHRSYAGLLLIDLDGFKLVNDTHGHEVGDAVLVETARRLQSITRDEDVVGRLGGDEFVVLVNRLADDEQAARAKALQISKKLIELINEPVEFDGGTLHVGASVGIRLLGFGRIDTGTAMREADVALYRAKQTGRGCAVVFED
jgi:diguanylate cyclase (GGDEF)-like protein